MADILHAVVEAVDIPVTLKIRTGWSPENRNGVSIALIAEDSGIQALSVHGRTRACAYRGNVEYETITAIKKRVSIPVIANGDITTATKAAEVFRKTGADAVMIGRGAHGSPWIFSEINHYLETGKHLPQLPTQEKLEVVLRHLKDLHNFYEGIQGVRVARKHIGWYLSKEQIPKKHVQAVFSENTAEGQLAAVAKLYAHTIGECQSRRIQQ